MARRIRRFGLVALVAIGLFSVLFLGSAYLVSGKYHVQERLAEARAEYVQVSFDNLSEPFVQSVLSVEDHRFFSHPGFDPFAFLRAMSVNASVGAFVQGGSTLTQQLAKNLFLSSERTFGRKFLELGLAMRIEQTLDKQQILELYVNSVTYGRNARGIRQASERYFGMEPDQLAWPEATLLAGLPQAPGRFDPQQNPDGAIWRQGLVVSTLVLHGVVDESQAKRILKTPLPFRSEAGKQVAGVTLEEFNPNEG